MAGATTFDSRQSTVGCRSSSRCRLSAVVPPRLSVVGRRMPSPLGCRSSAVESRRARRADGEEVVRPLTAEDVDTIGKACLFNFVNI